MRGSRPHNPKNDYIIIDDIWFYKENTGLYYLGNVPGEDGKRHPVRAHNYVWEKYNGKIPKGFSVHHLDKDPRNNDISNLALMSYSAHSSYHAKDHSEESKQRMNEIVRPAAVQWHQSEDGSEWHKQHYEEVTKEIWNTYVTKTCTVCGKEYQVKSCAAKKSKYCSDHCKNISPEAKQRNKDRQPQQWEYINSHLEERICSVCGKPFLAKKYYKTKNCSPECRAKAISQSKIEQYSHRD